VADLELLHLPPVVVGPIYTVWCDDNVCG
jgi:hypothetical protein